jgi:flavodoxin
VLSLLQRASGEIDVRTIMTNAKTLLVYYSRTGNTRRLAHAIARELHCDVEEIQDTRARLGFIEFLKSCIEALRGHHATIDAVRHDPKEYDLIIVGTPVWAASVSTSIRAYLGAHAGGFPDVAFFCTLGHQGSSGAFLEMQKLVGKPALAYCVVTASQIAAGGFEPQVAQFVGELAVRQKDKAVGEPARALKRGCKDSVSVVDLNQCAPLAPFRSCSTRRRRENPWLLRIAARPQFSGPQGRIGCQNMGD